MIANDTAQASDLTYTSKGGKLIYLCIVIDVFTGEVLVFNISRSHDASMVREAIERGMQRTRGIPVFFQHDRGSKYELALVPD